jgi:hypothetical protein
VKLNRQGRQERQERNKGRKLGVERAAQKKMPWTKSSCIFLARLGVLGVLGVLGGLGGSIPGG